MTIEEETPAVRSMAEPDVRTHGGHVCASVIEAEQEAARQVGERGSCDQSMVEREDQRPHIGEVAGPPRERRGHDVAHSFVARRRQQPGVR